MEPFAPLQVLWNGTGVFWFPSETSEFLDISELVVNQPIEVQTVNCRIR